MKQLCETCCQPINPAESDKWRLYLACLEVLKVTDNPMSIDEINEKVGNQRSNHQLSRVLTMLVNQGEVMRHISSTHVNRYSYVGEEA